MSQGLVNVGPKKTLIGYASPLVGDTKKDASTAGGIDHPRAWRKSTAVNDLKEVPDEPSNRWWSEKLP